MNKDWAWLTDNSIEFLKRGYLEKGEDPIKRFEEIAKTAEHYLKIEGFAEKFLSYLAKGYYSLSSPIVANFGRKRGLPAACNGSYIEDTMKSILSKNQEIGSQTKNGAGTSAYFGALRGRGVNVSTGGESGGSVTFMELFDSTTRIINQGDTRRGKIAMYLPIEHPDFLEFLKIGTVGHIIQGSLTGVCISDEWMQSMLDGCEEKQDRFAKLIAARYEKGHPYIQFSSTVNNNAPLCYKNKGERIHASNLCVTGDQRVVSNRGLLTVKELWEQGGDLELFDGHKKVKSSPMRLVEKNADVYKITLRNGLTHKVTSYHNVLTKTKFGSALMPCSSLNIGDKAAVQLEKGLFGLKSMEDEAFLLGTYQSNGTQSGETIMIDVWEHSFDLLDEILERMNRVCVKYDVMSKMRKDARISFTDCTVCTGTVKKKRLQSRALTVANIGFVKGIIPQWIWESDEKTQWQYIRGLFYADGTVNINPTSKSLYLSITNIDYKFMEDLQLLLLNLGIKMSLSLMRAAGESLLPDGKGGKKFYKTKNAYRLVSGNHDSGKVFEKNTGFLTRKGIFIEDREFRDNKKKFYEITSIDLCDKEDVYCVKVESAEHIWTCNGILSGNCSEIELSCDKDHSFVCVLSSINLLHWEDLEKTDAIETLSYFLDAVTEEYIQKTEGDEVMLPSHRFCKEQRAVGVGVLGWHSLLQSRMVPFESMEAKFLNSIIFKTINERTLKASKEMAVRFGEPEMLVGYGERQVCRVAIAPTTSSSLIFGGVSQSIEPYSSNFSSRGLAKSRTTFKNPYLKEILAKYGKDDYETWESIRVHNGSVQHLECLSDLQKEVFLTFPEISQKEILIQASTRQRFIDQSQSLNLNIPSEVHPSVSAKLIVWAWRNGVKSLYYQRGSNPSVDLAKNILTCKSCES